MMDIVREDMGCSTRTRIALALDISSCMEPIQPCEKNELHFLPTVGFLLVPYLPDCTIALWRCTIQLHLKKYCNWMHWHEVLWKMRWKETSVLEYHCPKIESQEWFCTRAIDGGHKAWNKSPLFINTSVPYFFKLPWWIYHTFFKKKINVGVVRCLLHLLPLTTNAVYPALEPVSQLQDKRVPFSCQLIYPKLLADKSWLL